MTITFTIKQVPDALAARLRQRAADHRRSLQKELLSIMETVAEWEDAPAAFAYSHIAEPAQVAYIAQLEGKRGKHTTRKATPGKLTLEQLWRRAHKLGAGTSSESAAIVRRDRDARGTLPRK